MKLYQNFSFLFYDYETFGKNPALDKPAQFACIRTDLEFNIIEDPKIFFCFPPHDYLPDPESIMITGITPQYTMSHGTNEAEFAKKIHENFIIPNTCILGYNNIQFDDEFTRNIFYRNFYDPYDYLWNNNNSRWDLINVLRTCHALRPNGISWPINELGLPSFKLKDICIANKIKFNNFHDALTDVYATLEITKLIKKMQPKVFNYLFSLRKKNKIIKLINKFHKTPLIYISGIFGAKQYNMSIILPIAWHPKNKNIFIACDLNSDLDILIKSDINLLYNQLYDNNNFQKKIKIPILLININKCPILISIKVLNSMNFKKIPLNFNYCFNNLSKIYNNVKITSKIITLFNKPYIFHKSENVDNQLYSGFFNKKDQLKIKIFQNKTKKKFQNLKFIDIRLNKLLFFYKARNYPHILTKQEKILWNKHIRQIITIELIHEFLKKIKNLLLIYKNDKKKQQILIELINYVNKISINLYGLEISNIIKNIKIN